MERRIEDKYDVIDELANRLDEIEEKLHNEVSKNMEVVAENDQLKRGTVISEACKDLSESQTEKMISLAEGVDFVSAEDFSEIIRTDGVEQTTYKGWPLYTCSNDVSAGDINGDGELDMGEFIALMYPPATEVT